jgi:type II secretory ATPase GspE/PulE/Tfp pilus assembly ATPase PilB-like protein
MSLGLTSLIIQNRTFKIDSIAEIIIRYHNYRGETSRITLMGYYEGDKNVIEIVLKNGESLKYDFLSDSKYDQQFLSNYIKKYSEIGVMAKFINE